MRCHIHSFDGACNELFPSLLGLSRCDDESCISRSHAHVASTDKEKQTGDTDSKPLPAHPTHSHA